MDASQVARHVSEGAGFTTSVIRPLSLARVPRTKGHPDLYNPPLYPLVLAIAFNLLGANDRAVGLVSAAFALLTALMAYFLGSRLLDRRAGALAALLVMLSLGFLKLSISGVSITLAAFLLTALCYLVARISGGSIRSWAGAGVICAFAYLTDYAALLLALSLGMVAVLGVKAGRLRGLGAFAAGFAIAVAPWLIRNWVVAGSPFAHLRIYSLAMFGDAYPGSSLYRLASAHGVAPITFLAGHYRKVIQKLLLNLGYTYSTIAGSYGVILIVLLGLGLFTDLGTAAVNRIKWALLCGLVLMAMSLAIGQPNLDALSAPVGVVAALGAVALVKVMDSRAASPRTRAATVAAVLALTVFPAGLYALPRMHPTKVDLRNLDYLKRALPTNAVVVTDQPWSVAWHAGRTAVWVPAATAPVPRQGERMLITEAADVTKSKGFMALEKAGARPDAIYLSSDLPSYPQQEGIGRWQLLYDVIGKQIDSAAAQQGSSPGTVWVPDGWVLAATLPPRDFLLLRAEAAGLPKPTTSGRAG
jgi:4-amino-4-deoxy-L-arabinose transferase-like glycosyltransferase